MNQFNPGVMSVNEASMKLPSDETVFPVAWYPVAWSKELTNKPIKRRLLGKDFVLFRNNRGIAKCLESYCAHRGADLSLGSCENGHVTCRYHGWVFNELGHCEAIPSHPDRPIPDFAKVRAFPMAERAQLLWVYPDDAMSTPETPSLDIFDELENDDFTLAPYSQDWNAHLTRVVESVLDVAHLAFVHKKTIGRNVSPRIAQLQFEVPNSNTIEIYNGGGHLEYRFPQQWILRPSQPGRSQFINYVVFSPIDTNKTRIFGYAGRTFARHIPGLNFIFSRYSERILREDQRVVESQHPRPIPEALRMEAHVPADGPQIRFRQRWYEFLTSDEPRVFL